ncbi:hypothetical protein [Hyphomicrobium sp. DMF-1]|uniref:hypothetical protein n=1 Tax=Hyphomicrobium sp. DMF-1 TaxID=3019544 RepID=UPI0022EBB369|nr:hypothetical protein [Hyphomicrobium sp. DMF-1]WBT40142.1 hypothetical protein PE058_09740 [Hyphomicrobium sp. DMF-1]
MTFFLDVQADPAAGVATISCLQTALRMALVAFAEVDRSKGLERLAQLEAEIMQEVKNTVPLKADEATEARVWLFGHGAVRTTFGQVRAIVEGNNDPGPA